MVSKQKFVIFRFHSKPNEVFPANKIAVCLEYLKRMLVEYVFSVIQDGK
jgi:hypothetical protein